MAKKICNTLSALLLAALTAVALAILIPMLLGYREMAVLSGSMEPTYHVGSLIYVKEVDPAELQVGDPITYVLNDDLTVVTHRIVEISEDGEYFKTKGDANDAEDGTLVHYKNVVGTHVFTIPYLGYFSNWITHAPGKYIAITAAVVFLILLFLPDMLKKADEADKKAAERKQ